MVFWNAHSVLPPARRECVERVRSPADSSEDLEGTRWRTEESAAVIHEPPPRASMGRGPAGPRKAGRRPARHGRVERARRGGRRVEMLVGAPLALALLARGRTVSEGDERTRALSWRQARCSPSSSRPNRRAAPCSRRTTSWTPKPPRCKRRRRLANLRRRLLSDHRSCLIGVFLVIVFQARAHLAARGRLAP